MQPISEVVHVNIFVESTQVARAGFGVLLIAAYHTHWPERVRTYSASTALETLEAEGFDTNEPTVLMMQRILAQNPRVREVKVGRRDTQTDQTVSIFPVVAEQTLYSGYIMDPNGDEGPYRLDWSFTSGDLGEGATPEAIAQQMADAINAEREPNGVEATAVDDHVDLGYPPPIIPRVFSVSPPTGAGQYTTAATGAAGDITSDLNLIYAADPSWYGLLVDAGTKDVILDAADWAEAHRTIYCVSTADGDTLASPDPLSTDVASELHARAYKRTVLSYHIDPSAALAAGWLGVMLPYEPGVATWAFKTIAGVPVSNELTTTQLGNLRAKSCNHYTNVGGVNVMRWGTAAGGTFVDNTICVDWATARIEEEVWALLASAPKLPFTDMSGDRIGATVMGVLLRGVNQGVFADNPAPTVTVPAVADIPPTERAQRLFGTVEFTARLAGAIHEITIVGRVTV